MIIPACAGNSDRSLRGFVSERDHPRVCGEQEKCSSHHANHQGSSPRVRGTALTGTIDAPIDRIIPACAGNSGVDGEHRWIEWDHPRVCGEQPAPDPTK